MKANTPLLASRASRRLLTSRAVPVVGEWCRAAAREPAAPITTVSSPWGVWWMVRVSGSVFLARRDGGDSARSLARFTCLEVATRKQGSTGSRRVVQGGRKGASCTDHHSEQPLGGLEALSEGRWLSCAADYLFGNSTVSIR